MKCLDDKTLYALIDGDLAEDARRKAMKHVDDCGRCMARLRELVGSERVLQQAWSAFREEPCPSPEQLHAYAEGTLPSDERAAVKRHAEQCEVCSLTLEHGAELAAEYARQEARLLKDNRERLGSQLYETVERFLAKRFAEVQSVLSQADAFRFALKPVPAFRGAKPAEAPARRLPVMCTAGTVIVAVAGQEPQGIRLRLVDSQGTTVAEQTPSEEGVVVFSDIAAGYYTVEVVEAEASES